MGASYVVIPSTFHEIETSPDEIDQSELNTQRALKASFDLFFWFVTCIPVRVADTLIQDNLIQRLCGCLILGLAGIL